LSEIQLKCILVAFMWLNLSPDITLQFNSYKLNLTKISKLCILILQSNFSDFFIFHNGIFVKLMCHISRDLPLIYSQLIKGLNQDKRNASRIQLIYLKCSFMSCRILGHSSKVKRRGKDTGQSACPLCWSRLDLTPSGPQPIPIPILSVFVGTPKLRN